MPIVTQHTPDTFCWTDLGTTDVAGAKKFYQGIFGCKFADHSMGMGDARYSMLQIDGKDTCALYPVMDDQKKLKIPPHWLAYISVKSVDETVRKAKAAGGKVISEPMDVMKSGRMAILQDPTGAGFAIWEAREHIGAKISGVHGSVCWRELMTPNVDVAGKFYSTLFGWEIEGNDMGNGMTYHQLTKGDEGVGGMMLPPMEGIPPHWMTYWVVDDCDQTVAKIRELGGNVIVPGTDIPGIGRFAVADDPQGAGFAVMQPLASLMP